MTPFRVLLSCCALVVALEGVRAAEVEATPACCHHRRSCYSPCEPVGPVRRVLRKIFLKPCPPPCPVPRAVVIVPPPCPAPVTWTQPPASVGRPFVPPSPQAPPPPAPEVPFPGATSSRPQKLTPPTPQIPVRLDHLASRNGE